MRGLRYLLAGILLAFATAGCMGSDDERRTGALGENEQTSLSWGGEWSAETDYREGTVVTHDGVTFVAVAPTNAAPSAKCEVDCAWSVMAEAGAATVGQPPAPGIAQPQHDAFYFRTGYDGPAELPEATPQAVNDWLAEIARWTIRHQDDGGTVMGNRVEAAGNYLVFARGVYGSAPGLGKETIPQGASPTLGALVSAGMSVGSLVKSSLPRFVGNQLPDPLLRALKGPGVSEYTLSCTLLAGDTPLDQMSVAISDRGTGTLSLMGFSAVAADTKLSVGCSHNGKKAGPFVRDLYVVAFRYH
jgi:hypothetical protein